MLTPICRRPRASRAPSGAPGLVEPLEQRALLSADFSWAVPHDGIRDRLATDANGCVYALGMTGLSKFDAGGNVLWRSAVSGEELAVDSAGNLYVVGATLRKFDSSGALIWEQRITDSEGPTASVVAVDDAGNVYVGGQFDQTVDFDPDADVFELTSDRYRDVPTRVPSGFVSRFTAEGAFVQAWSTHGMWARTFDLAPAGDGSIYAVTRGWYPYHSAAWVTRIDSTGAVPWSTYLSTPGPRHYANPHITVSAAGEVYVASEYIQFQELNSSAAGFGVFAFSDEGSVEQIYNMMWALDRPGLTGAGVVAAPDDSLYVAGSFSGTYDFDPGPGVAQFISSGSDAFVFKLKPSGDLAWARTFGGTADDSVTDMVRGPSNALYLAGYVGGTADLDPGPGIHSLTTAATGSAFLLKLQDQGTPQQISRLGDAVRSLRDQSTVARGEAKSLLALLQNAGRAVGSGNSDLAIQQLGSFQRRVARCAAALDPDGASYATKLAAFTALRYAADDIVDSLA